MSCPIGISCAGMMQKAYLTVEDCENLQTCIATNLGITLEVLGGLEKALTSYDQAIDVYPDDFLAWHNRGKVLEKLGRDEEALTSYDQAIDVYPDYFLAWQSRSKVLEKLGRDEEALTSYDQAIDVYPYYFWAWYNRGEVLEKLGRDEEALASYDQAEALQHRSKRKIVFDVVARLPNQFQYADVIERTGLNVSWSTINRALAQLRESGQIRCIKLGRDAVWEKTREIS